VINVLRKGNKLASPHLGMDNNMIIGFKENADVHRKRESHAFRRRNVKL
jgi:hypothetical protein